MTFSFIGALVMSHNSKKLLAILASSITVGICLFYIYIHLSLPYLGFTISWAGDGWRVITSDTPDIVPGDLITRIGNDAYQQALDRAEPLLDDLYPGKQVVLSVARNAMGGTATAPMDMAGPVICVAHCSATLAGGNSVVALDRPGTAVLV